MSNIFRSVLLDMSNKDLLDVMARCGAVVNDTGASHNVKRVFYKLAKIIESEYNKRLDKEG